MILETCNHQNFVVVFNSEIDPLCPVCNMEPGEEPATVQSLNDLSDVNILSPEQGDTIRYNPVTSKFEKFHLMETADRTINLDNSMSAAEIQTIIDSIGKCIVFPTIITLQFADGTYIMDEKLHFYGFYGGGGIRIWGNRTEANHDTLHTTQEVYLQHGSYNGVVIHLEACGIWFDIYNLLATVKTDSDADRVIQIDAVLNAELRFNYFTGTNHAQGSCIHAFKNAAIGAKNNYFGNAKYAIICQNSRFSSWDNDDMDAQPDYGLRADYGGVIGKLGTQPSGQVANETTSGGSVIR